MASRFPLLILTVSTIFLLIGICISLPYRRDTSIQLDDCDENVPHVVIVNSTDGTVLNCHKCLLICQGGLGLSTPCNGENVSQTDLNIECKLCVAGMNFSTGGTFQCQPCQMNVCQDGMKVEGKCEPTRDKRTCKLCNLTDWYYNKTQEICLPCFCGNMTAEIKRICSGLGISIQCNKDGANSTTNTPFTPHNNKRDIWETKYIIVIVVCGILFLLVLVCVTVRAKKFNVDHPSVSMCSKDWFCQMCFFKEATRSRPPSYSVEDRHAHNGNGCAERVQFLRQSSCPVTQNEKLVVNNSPHASLKEGDSQENVKFLGKNTECHQKKMKFFDMNSETCREICQKLKQNIETGMGYPTLAGYMGFSANKVKTFECEGDPCKNMLECWSSLDDTKNNVLKLKDLVVKLKRDDILKLLKSELKKKRDECGCSECVVVL